MIDQDFVRDYINNYAGQCYGQLKQDVMVLAMTNSLHYGYFVEFGVMDGIYASNTYLLETAFGWKGIVCEPGQVFHDQIMTNRKCIKDFRAVTDIDDQQVVFKETQSQLGLSGVKHLFHKDDMHAQVRAASAGDEYPVNTVCLNSLLAQHHAPEYIDFISVDTEGSELPILSAFDFDKYKVTIWAVEHNWVVDSRNQIKALLESHGYQRFCTEQSQYDDWYVREDLLGNTRSKING